MRLIDSEPMPAGELWEQLTDIEKYHVLHFLNSRPTVDAEIVTHAYWISHPDSYYPHNNCSNCGHTIKYKFDLTDYCSKCGAKMDETK